MRAELNLALGKHTFLLIVLLGCCFWRETQHRLEGIKLCVKAAPWHSLQMYLAPSRDPLAVPAIVLLSWRASPPLLQHHSSSDHSLVQSKIVHSTPRSQTNLYHHSFAPDLILQVPTDTLHSWLALSLLSIPCLMAQKESAAELSSPARLSWSAEYLNG